MTLDKRANALVKQGETIDQLATKALDVAFGASDMAFAASADVERMQKQLKKIQDSIVSKKDPESDRIDKVEKTIGEIASKVVQLETGLTGIARKLTESTPKTSKTPTSEQPTPKTSDTPTGEQPTTSKPDSRNPGASTDATKSLDKLNTYAGNIAHNIQSIADQMGAYVISLKETREALQDEREADNIPADGEGAGQAKGKGKFIKDTGQGGGLLGSLGRGFLSGAGGAISKRLLGKAGASGAKVATKVAGAAVKEGGSAIMGLMKSPKALVLALVAAIGTGIYKYFTDDEFKKSVSSFFSSALDLGKDMIIKPLMNLFGSLKEGLFNVIADVFDAYSGISIPIPGWLQKIGLPGKLEPFSFLKNSSTSLRASAEESKKSRTAEGAQPTDGAAGTDGLNGAPGAAGAAGMNGPAGAAGMNGTAGAASNSATAVRAPAEVGVSSTATATTDPMATAMTKAGVTLDPDSGIPTYKGLRFPMPATPEDLNKAVKAIDEGTPTTYKVSNPMTGQIEDFKFVPPGQKIVGKSTVTAPPPAAGGAAGGGGSAQASSGGSAAPASGGGSEGSAASSPAASPINSSPTTGADIGSASADVAFKKNEPAQDAVVVDSSKNRQTSSSSASDNGPIPSPIANRGSIDQFNYFNPPGIMKET